MLSPRAVTVVRDYCCRKVTASPQPMQNNSLPRETCVWPLWLRYFPRPGRGLDDVGRFKQVGTRFRGSPLVGWDAATGKWSWGKLGGGRAAAAHLQIPLVAPFPPPPTFHLAIRQGRNVGRTAPHRNPRIRTWGVGRGAIAFFCAVAESIPPWRQQLGGGPGNEPTEQAGRTASSDSTRGLISLAILLLTGRSLLFRLLVRGRGT